MGKKYIILGGNGFIGRNLCDKLISEGECVTVFDCQVSIVSNPLAECIIGDFFDDNILYEAIKDKDVIIHAISTVNPGNSNEKFLDGYGKDLLQTIKLCSWIKDTEKKLIFISSGGTVYGECFGECFYEDSLPLPINHYANIKLTIENALRIFQIQNTLQITIARVSNPYGFGQDYIKGVGFIDAVLKQAMSNNVIEIWGDGNTIRDYIYINDVCECLYQLSKYSGSEYIFNVSSGVGTTQKEIINIVQKMGLNVNVVYKDARSVDVKKVVLNNNKIRKMCNVVFTPLEQGISNYLNFLLENNA